MTIVGSRRAVAALALTPAQAVRRLEQLERERAALLAAFPDLVDVPVFGIKTERRAGNGRDRQRREAN